MGNVSRAVPTIHPSLAICDHGVAWHSIESLRAAATPRADETTLLAASLVARTALDLLLDPRARGDGVEGVPWRGVGVGRAEHPRV